MKVNAILIVYTNNGSNTHYCHVGNAALFMGRSKGNFFIVSMPCWN